MRTGAEFSPCRTYRYALWREWGAGPSLTVIGLNPSTADAVRDDPTIRRCLGFARREGCTRLVILNLYALRATDPLKLWRSTDPVGPENDSYLSNVTGLVVAAWGVNAQPDRVRQFYQDAEAPLLCFGTTKNGAPRHPLYVRSEAPLIPWRATPPPEAPMGGE